MNKNKGGALKSKGRSEKTICDSVAQGLWPHLARRPGVLVAAGAAATVAIDLGPRNIANMLLYSQIHPPQHS